MRSLTARKTDRYMRNGMRIIKLTFTLGLILSIPALTIAELRVGFIGGFSGPGEAFGHAARNGFELAREQFGKEGIEVIYEDDQFSPPKTVTSFKKLIDHDKVDLIIVLGSTPAAAIAPLAEKHQIPLIAWGSAKHLAEDRKWVIRSWPSGDEEGAALAAKSKELQLKRIATIVYSDEYALGVINGFQSSTDAELIDLGEVSPVERDFSSVALRAKAKQVDGMAICLSVGQSADLALKLRQINFSPIILGCETLNNGEEVALSKGTLLGAWYATVPVRSSFVTRYKEKFKANTSISGAAIHFEIYNILKEMADRNVRSKTLMERLLVAKRSSSVLGEFHVSHQGNDQWFKLPIGVESVSEAG